MSNRQNPIPLRPVLISLTAHALILFIFVPNIPNVPAEARPGRLTVRLALAKSAAERSAGTTTASDAKKSSRPIKPSFAPSPQVRAHPAAVRSPVPAAPTSQESAPLGAQEPVGTRGEAALAPSAETIAVGDDLRAYRMSLAVAVRRFDLRDAEGRGRRGRVVLGIIVPSLGVPDVHLLQSSGDGLLDGWALTMLAQAAQWVSVPETLRRQGMRLEVPVEFGPVD